MTTTSIPVGARVRLRHVQGFLKLSTDTATVIGPGSAPGLVAIRLDTPGICTLEDEPHEVVDLGELAENLTVLDASPSS